MTFKPAKVAIIGSGATTIYLLRHIFKNIAVLKSEITQISIFEKEDITGMGMPYSPNTTDIYNMANISSEEIPELFISFADWLREQPEDTLQRFHIQKSEISDAKVYSRLALGLYFRSQYEHCIASLQNSGISIVEHPSVEIIDIIPKNDTYELITKNMSSFITDKVIIATGHSWSEQDNLKTNFYSSPWPISKILPSDGEIYNFPIGILGASLSAFDVVASIANRHGTFSKNGQKLVYHPFENTTEFKLVLHDANGWLPNLQYEQDEPMREIYRHASREDIFQILDDQKHLRIHTYFDKICKPALQKAFLKDNLSAFAITLKNPNFGFKEFVTRMSERHEYENAFEGMKIEMVEAKNSVLNNKPIHWKEVIDDLMYTLNYHAELMPADDHVFFRKEVKPFLMNVIAALPLQSGEILLALYEVGKLTLQSGLVEIEEPLPTDEVTKIKISQNDSCEQFEYKMFISCGGQKDLELSDYSFKTLVSENYISSAKAILTEPDILDKDNYNIITEGSKSYIEIGGISIDASYRIRNTDGVPNDTIYDVSFTHASGLRPYSYGLQACSATTEIMVANWVNFSNREGLNQGSIEQASKVYSENTHL